ncbi:MAG: hypothetical protein ACR2GG_10755, partial [Gemmatimonadaceae bacterium]
RSCATLRTPFSRRGAAPSSPTPGSASWPPTLATRGSSYGAAPNGHELVVIRRRGGPALEEARAIRAKTRDAGLTPAVTSLTA